MKAVSGIDNFGAVLAGFFGSQPRYHAAHRRVSMDNIVVLLIDNLSQLFVGGDVAEFERAARERHDERLVAIKDFFLAHRRVMNFPAVFAHHAHEWAVEFLEAGNVRCK